MKHKKIKIFVASAALLCGATGAWAQIRPAYSYPAKPAYGTQMGDTPAYYSWWLGTGVGYDDNVLLTQRNERTSGFYVVNPGLRIDARSPHSVIELTQQWQLGRYWSSHNDDYIDHSTHAQADMAFSQRAFGRVGLDYIKSHDPRGSTDRRHFADTGCVARSCTQRDVRIRRARRRRPPRSLLRVPPIVATRTTAASPSSATAIRRNMAPPCT